MLCTLFFVTGKSKIGNCGLGSRLSHQWHELMRDEADEEVVEKEAESQIEEVYRTETHSCLKTVLAWILANVTLSTAVP